MLKHHKMVSGGQIFPETNPAVNSVYLGIYLGDLEQFIALPMHPENDKSNKPITNLYMYPLVN